MDIQSHCISTPSKYFLHLKPLKTNLGYTKSIRRLSTDCICMYSGAELLRYPAGSHAIHTARLNIPIPIPHLQTNHPTPLPLDSLLPSQHGNNDQDKKILSSSSLGPEISPDGMMHSQLPRKHGQLCTTQIAGGRLCRQCRSWPQRFIRGPDFQATGAAAFLTKNL